MSPQAIQGSTKPVADNKMERHFNGILMTVLSISAVVMLVTAIYLRLGTKARSLLPSQETSHPSPQ